VRSYSAPDTTARAGGFTSWEKTPQNRGSARASAGKFSLVSKRSPCRFRSGRRPEPRRKPLRSPLQRRSGFLFTWSLSLA
jgi:hypothetical protein